MDDFSALAQRVALSGEDVRGCLILSRDGLVLGAYPTVDDSVAKAAWLKFARSLGDPERGFVQFAEQVWVFARRGPYSVFAVGGPAVRPGVLLDTAEQALLSAEQSRTNREALKVPEAPAAPTGKPRAPLHPPADRPVAIAASGPPSAPQGVSDMGRSAATDGSSTATPAADVSGAGTEPSADAGAGESTPTSTPADKEQPKKRRPEPRFADQPEASEEDAEVDRIMLAQEFSGLLQPGDRDDEGSS